ncbi:3-hydroxyacyl-ACP dehydratase FabZ family protein [Actinophytocola oryzae]|uniref:3-hydroxymyristoyl/3-hydroxydecanoyl-(Acyl carrier protein) dehydratase n=1 Tax=Actinophytocola oryzae TaxID=502181 RepID=A0A4R7VXP2_9PSEU|nr:polyketide synthase dehydratase domain-containing protein [Actinophytocola oryzae]TDV54804.1 3-hydroxymyristoyl/3-hydroxydecanoyl-(acyl carrier protein) dehydratase [Actinophytocola oryzae]
MTAIAAPSMAIPLSAVDYVRIGAAGELTAEKAIVTGNPYLAGHYPGRPIYPGVFVVESVLQATRRLLGNPELVLAEIESVRFQAPLLPGDTLHLTLSFTTDPDGGYVVRARGTRADGSAAASMTVRATEPYERVRSAPHVEVTPVTRAASPVDVRDLLPHRGPILLADRVVAHVPGERVVTEFTVRTSQPCYRGLPSEADREVCAYPDSLVVESFTQACAVLFLLERRPRPVTGTLAFGNARAVRMFEPVLPGQTIRHEAWLDRVVGDTALVRGRSTVDGRVCLTAGSLAVLARDGLTVAGR